MVEERLKSRVQSMRSLCLDKVPAARDNGANGGVHMRVFVRLGRAGRLLLLGGVIARRLRETPRRKPAPAASGAM